MVMRPSHLEEQVVDTRRCLIHAKLMTANEAKLHKKTLTCLEHQRNDETDAQDQSLLRFSDCLFLLCLVTLSIIVLWALSFLWVAISNIFTNDNVSSDNAMQRWISVIRSDEPPENLNLQIFFGLWSFLLRFFISLATVWHFLMGLGAKRTVVEVHSLKYSFEVLVFYHFMQLDTSNSATFSKQIYEHLCFYGDILFPPTNKLVTTCT